MKWPFTSVVLAFTCISFASSVPIILNDMGVMYPAYPFMQSDYSGFDFAKLFQKAANSVKNWYSYMNSWIFGRREPQNQTVSQSNIPPNKNNIHIEAYKVYRDEKGNVIVKNIANIDALNAQNIRDSLSSVAHHKDGLAPENFLQDKNFNFMENEQNHAVKKDKPNNEHSVRKNPFKWNENLAKDELFAKVGKVEPHPDRKVVMHPIELQINGAFIPLGKFAGIKLSPRFGAANIHQHSLGINSQGQFIFDNKVMHQPKNNKQDQPKVDQEATTQNSPKIDQEGSTQNQPKVDQEATTQNQPKVDQEVINQNQQKVDEETNAQKQPNKEDDQNKPKEEEKPLHKNEETSSAPAEAQSKKESTNAETKMKQGLEEKNNNQNQAPNNEQSPQQPGQSNNDQQTKKQEKPKQPHPQNNEDNMQKAVKQAFNDYKDTMQKVFAMMRPSQSQNNPDFFNINPNDFFADFKF